MNHELPSFHTFLTWTLLFDHFLFLLVTFICASDTYYISQFLLLGWYKNIIVFNLPGEFNHSPLWCFALLVFKLFQWLKFLFSRINISGFNKPIKDMTENNMSNMQLGSFATTLASQVLGGGRYLGDFDDLALWGVLAQTLSSFTP